MGDLDDAIREHIELKRRHGASESDLSRQEQEALGPARREAPAAPDPDDLPETGAEQVVEPAAEHFEVAPTEVVPPVAEPAAEPEPVAEPATEPEPVAEPELGEPAREPRPDDSGEDEDVLEETPEFLQETPEHDRLWFEQKPPRNFDFDQ